MKRFRIRIMSVNILEGARYEEVTADSETEARQKVQVEDDEFISCIMEF